MPPILSTHMWVSLSNEQRNLIRSIFNIPRSKAVEVHDGVVVTDGTTPEDFKALTIEKMQQYVNSDLTDFHKLFDLVIAKVTDKLLGKPDIIVVAHTPITVISEPKKRGRPKK